MSVSISAPTTTTTAATANAPKPSFFGVLRGELFKLRKQRSSWLLLLVLAGIICLPYIISMAAPNRIKEFLAVAPLAMMYRFAGSNLLVFRVFVGPVLIILTARLIGMEYSGGTIRVLLARGVGRLQLLFAKLAACFLVAALILVGALAMNVVLSLVMLSSVTGNLDVLQSLDATFWHDMLIYVGTVCVSMAVTMLMAGAMAVLGRSLAFGLSAALGFFPADNIGQIFFLLAASLTSSNNWLVATGDLLGPNLNAMPSQTASPQIAGLLGRGLEPPLVTVSGGHTLLIAGVWAAAFIVVMVGLTWKRDVTQ